MNDLLRRRFVGIDSETSIDSLQPGNVVFWKNAVPHVFECKEGSRYCFYYPSVLNSQVVEIIVTDRNCLSAGGNQIVHAWGDDQRITFKPKDGESYSRRKDDLVALGLAR